MVKVVGGVLCVVSVILLIITFIVSEPQKSWLSFKILLTSIICGSTGAFLMCELN